MTENRDAIDHMREDLKGSTGRKDEKKAARILKVTDAGIKRHTRPRV